MKKKSKDNFHSFVNKYKFYFIFFLLLLFPFVIGIIILRLIIDKRIKKRKDNEKEV